MKGAVLCIPGFLFNLLVSQFCGVYSSLAADIKGYARLARGKIILDTLKDIQPKRWKGKVKISPRNPRLTRKPNKRKSICVLFSFTCCQWLVWIQRCHSRRIVDSSLVAEASLVLWHWIVGWTSKKGIWAWRAASRPWKPLCKEKAEGTTKAKTCKGPKDNKTHMKEESSIHLT